GPAAGGPLEAGLKPLGQLDALQAFRAAEEMLLESLRLLGCEPAQNEALHDVALVDGCVIHGVLALVLHSESDSMSLRIAPDRPRAAASSSSLNRLRAR